jgi:hypothetical protein
VTVLLSSSGNGFAEIVSDDFSALHAMNCASFAPSEAAAE